MKGNFFITTYLRGVCGQTARVPSIAGKVFSEEGDTLLCRLFINEEWVKWLTPIPRTQILNDNVRIFPSGGQKSFEEELATLQESAQGL